MMATTLPTYDETIRGVSFLHDISGREKSGYWSMFGVEVGNEVAVLRPSSERLLSSLPPLYRASGADTISLSFSLHFLFSAFNLHPDVHIVARSAAARYALSWR
jgi:hypothetical protein